MAALLEIEDLQVSYGRIQAIKGISLHVDAGEVVAVLGANGAGKTTLMRALSGLIPAQGGRIVFGGRDITRARAASIVRAGIGQSPEGRLVFGTLTVRENLELGGFTRTPAEVRERCQYVYEIFPRLHERRRQLAGTLSGGEQQMLAIGRALVAKPKLLLLDEPSLGLAPIIVRNIFEILRQVRETGMTILIVEQNARMALQLADRGYVLEVGKLAHSGTAQELITSPEIQAAYLGRA